jgi:hypothetical protein
MPAMPRMRIRVLLALVIWIALILLARLVDAVL